MVDELSAEVVAVVFVGCRDVIDLDELDGHLAVEPEFELFGRVDDAIFISGNPPPTKALGEVQ